MVKPMNVVTTKMAKMTINVKGEEKNNKRSTGIYLETFKAIGENTYNNKKLPIFYDVESKKKDSQTAKLSIAELSTIVNALEAFVDGGADKFQGLANKMNSKNPDAIMFPHDTGKTIGISIARPQDPAAPIGIRVFTSTKNKDDNKSLVHEVRLFALGAIIDMKARLNAALEEALKIDTSLGHGNVITTSTSKMSLKAGKEEGVYFLENFKKVGETEVNNKKLPIFYDKNAEENKKKNSQVFRFDKEGLNIITDAVNKAVLANITGNASVFDGQASVTSGDRTVSVALNLNEGVPSGMKINIASTTPDKSKTFNYDVFAKTPPTLLEIAGKFNAMAGKFPIADKKFGTIMTSNDNGKLTINAKEEDKGNNKIGSAVYMEIMKPVGIGEDPKTKQKFTLFYDKENKKKDSVAAKISIAELAIMTEAVKIYEENGMEALKGFMQRLNPKYPNSITFPHNGNATVIGLSPTKTNNGVRFFISKNAENNKRTVDVSVTDSTQITALRTKMVAMLAEATKVEVNLGNSKSVGAETVNDVTVDDLAPSN